MSKVFFVIIFVILNLFSVNNTFADIFTSPVKYDINVNKGDIVTHSVTIFNNSNEAVELVPGKVNIESDGVSGIPKLVYDNSKLKYPEQQIKDWINLNTMDIITVDAFSKKTISFGINVPIDAIEGGHYGMVTFTAPKNKNSFDFNLTYGSIILLNVEGNNVRKTIELNKIDIKSSNHLPKFNINLRNKGNTHITPKGKIFLYNQKGEQIENIGKDIIFNDHGAVIGEKVTDYLQINKFRRSILPGTNRIFTVELEGDLSYFDNEYIDVFLEVTHSNEDGEEIKLLNKIDFINTSNINFELLTKNEILRNIKYSKDNLLKLNIGSELINKIDIFISKANDDKLKKLENKIKKLPISIKNNRKYKYIFSYLENNVLLKLYY